MEMDAWGPCGEFFLSQWIYTAPIWIALKKGSKVLCTTIWPETEKKNVALSQNKRPYKVFILPRVIYLLAATTLY